MTRPTRDSLFRTLSLSLVAGPALQACVVAPPPPPPPDPYGDIAFDWSFAGTLDCNEAGVDEIDLVVLQNGVVVREIEREPCIGGGLVLTDFLEGPYEVDIDAYDRESVELYAGSFAINVQGGVVNNAGLVELEALFDPEPVTGGLGFFWSFLYPADTAITACNVAGVVDVDVTLTPDGGAPLVQTYSCDEDGALYEVLNVGNYTVAVDAWGRYHDADLHLYSYTTTARVDADTTVELGTLPLARDEESFADVNVSWDFTGTTCAAEGIGDVTISILRQGLSQPDDVATASCTSLSALRRTFVPGSYVVTVDAVGTDTSFRGFASVDVGADVTVEVPVNLAPLVP